MSPVAGMSDSSFIAFAVISIAIVVAAIGVAAYEFPRWRATRCEKIKQPSLRQELAEASWRWWLVASSVVAATIAVVGLWAWAQHAIMREIPYPEITEIGALIFNCDVDHRFGAQIWLKFDDNTINPNRPPVEARACFDFSKRAWYLKNRANFVPYGR